MKLLVKHGMTVEVFGTLGSKRYYFLTHVGRIWATEQEHAHPILRFNFGWGTFLGHSRRFLRELPFRLISLTQSKQISKDLSIATETFVLARK